MRFMLCVIYDSFIWHDTCSITFCMIHAAIFQTDVPICKQILANNLDGNQLDDGTLNKDT